VFDPAGVPTLQVSEVSWSLGSAVLVHEYPVAPAEQLTALLVAQEPGGGGPALAVAVAVQPVTNAARREHKGIPRKRDDVRREKKGICDSLLPD
jgi:hypothetical protein